MYIIYYNNEEFHFDTAYYWNLSIMSILYEDVKLTAIKDGLGGCIIE